jgi:hypothetical protein
MKRYAIAAGSVLALIAIVLALRIQATIQELSVYYLNIRVLAPVVEISTVSESKDRANRFLYAYSGRVIVESRKSTLGRFASSWIENKDTSFMKDRSAAESFVVSDSE